MAGKKTSRGNVLHPVSQGRGMRMVQAPQRFQHVDVEAIEVVRVDGVNVIRMTGSDGSVTQFPSKTGVRWAAPGSALFRPFPTGGLFPKKIDVITDAVRRQLEQLSSQALGAVNAEAFAAHVISALPQETLSEWDDLVGPFYSTDSLMKQLKVSRQAISKAKLEHRILATPTGDGTMLYPSFQFEGDDTPTCLPHLKDLMPILRGAGMTPWSIALWLKTRRPELNELAPHEALRRTDEQVESVLDLASDDTRRRTAA